MARRRPSRPGPYTQRAQAEADVKFGPELSVLRSALRDADEALGAGIGRGAAISQEGIRAVRAARPVIADIYKRSGEEIKQAQARVDADIANLTKGVGSRSAEGIAGVRQASATALAAATAHAKASLEREAFMATQAGAGVTQQALAEHAKTSRTLQGQIANRASQRGSYVTTRASDLYDKASDRRHRNRVEDRQERSDNRANADRDRKFNADERHREWGRNKPPKENKDRRKKNTTQIEAVRSIVAELRGGSAGFKHPTRFKVNKTIIRSVAGAKKHRNYVIGQIAQDKRFKGDTKLARVAYEVWTGDYSQSGISTANNRGGREKFGYRANAPRKPSARDLTSLRW